MPQSDNVDDYISKFPLFVPFAKTLFSAPAIVNIPTTLAKRSSEIDEAELLPSVCTTASVKWSGRDGEGASHSVSARVDLASGLPAPDARESAASKKAADKRNKRKQQQNAAEGVKAGDKCYINLRAWPEYHEEWLYPSPIEKTFVLGVYGDVMSGKGRRRLRKLVVPAFDYMSMTWISTGSPNGA